MGKLTKKKKHGIMNKITFVFFFLGDILTAACFTSQKHLKPKQEIKAACGTLLIFKERDSFDWCYSRLLHSMVSSA